MFQTFFLNTFRANAFSKTSNSESSRKFNTQYSTLSMVDK